MAEPAGALSPSARAALEKLADIIVPPPVSFVPQTWGWAVLGIGAMLVVLWAALRWRRRWLANRYRAEALAELAAIERNLDRSVAPGAMLAAIPPLLKRVALAAWPRPRVAALAQSHWVDFIAAAAGENALPASLARLLNDGEYRIKPEDLAAIPLEETRTCVTAARHWIEAHRVSA
jgi:hypothetical protein